MISLRRFVLSLFVLSGCAQESSERSAGGAPERPELAQVASTGVRDWSSAGGTASSGPAICSGEPGRFDVFVRGADSAIWHRAWIGEAWEEWESLGGSAVSDPAAVSWGPGRIDLFMRGRDNALHRKVFESGSWSANWERIGGTVTSSPAVTSSAPGRLDIFARGPEGNLWQKTYETGWTDWKRVGPSNFTLTSDPAAVSWGPGRIDVVARGATGDFNQITFDDGRWGSWQALGQNLTSQRTPPPSAVSWLRNLLGLSFPRNAEQLWLRWVLELASNAASNAELTPAPALASWGPGRLDLFATSTDGTLWQRSYQNGAWGELVSLGGKVSAVDAVAWGGANIDLVARDANNTIVYKYFDGASW